MGLTHLLITVTLTFGEYRAFLLQISTPPKAPSAATPQTTTPQSASPQSATAQSPEASPQAADPSAAATGPKTRSIITTLDDLQYPEYYPLGPGETVTYLDSWMCWERTNGRAPCPQPTPQTVPPPARAPSSGPETNLKPTAP